MHQFQILFLMNGGEQHCEYFVQCNKTELRAEFKELIQCVCMLFLFIYLFIFSQKWCPRFKSPSPKWAHHKTNTVWQRAGSLCSYEAQNLMSMNNEYYSTCWWLSRLPVIRSMKALFSRERSLSLQMTDSITPSHILEITFAARQMSRRRHWGWLLPMISAATWPP